MGDAPDSSSAAAASAAAPPLPENARLKHDGLLALEQPLIRAPLEQLKRVFRSSQKLVEREMASLASNVDSVISKSASSPESANAACIALDASISRLNSLKRKLNEIKTEEDIYLNRTKVRLDHLAELSSIQAADSEAYARWSKTRLARVLVDYMLRQGFSASAIKLAQDSNIQNLVDIELFMQSRKIEDSLKNRSCTEGLQWCSDNKSCLKKSKSTLEFNLRLQEYIELLRVRNVSQAIAYARKHLTPWSETHLREIQQAMGLIAFGPDTDCEQYKALYDLSRWDELVDQFRADNYALNCLTSQPPLRMTLQAGLSALKSLQCYKPQHKNINCPVCDSDTFGDLAEKLPCSHHVNSCIVCRISGRIVDADNPPLVLPNGQVYSKKALQEMAAVNAGTVKCPTTGSVFRLAEARKAFVS